ncbi:hypothetical protein VNO80_14774 [Phaseolus coccineus]|uniref:Uncharacterized protein n=1 Tax=Phaseolus coccineus TaxID=3886 RepID=A0AAN9MIZ3_PHACN
MTPHTPFGKAMTIVMGSTNGIQGARHTTQQRLGYEFGEIRGTYKDFNKEGKREMKVDNNHTLFLFAGTYDDSRVDAYRFGKVNSKELQKDRRSTANSKPIYIRRRALLT